MKLRCFTSLIVTVIMASTAGAVEVYNNDGNTLNIFGNIAGGQYFSKNKSNTGSHSFIKYGFISQTEINDKVFGFGTWENEISLQNVEEEINLKGGNSSLLGYVGISVKKIGSIDYGRNYGLLYDVSSWTDIIPGFGGDLSTADNFLSSRASNVLTYRNSDFFGLFRGLNLAAQYQMKNDINQYTGRTVKTANGEGYGVSISYALNNDIVTSAAYVNSKRTPEQRQLDGGGTITYTSGSAEAYSVGIKYNAYGIYAAATYGETYNMTPFGNFDDPLNPESIYGFVNKARNAAVIAQYHFDFGLSPSISYVHSKASDIDNGYGNYLKKFVTVGVSYVFNKNVSTSVDYRINLLNKNDFTTAAKISTDDLYAMGISYIF